MDVDEFPNMNMDKVINEMSSEKNQATLPTTEDLVTDIASEQTPHREAILAIPILEFPIASSSKTKYSSVSTAMKKEKIQEFLRVLRPHLPRKSKSKAYKMLQNIAKGTVLKSTFQPIITKNKPKKRTVRKQKTRQLKTKSLSVVRRNDRSLYGSSDSCQSNTSCPHCGHSYFKIARC